MTSPVQIEIVDQPDGGLRVRTPAKINLWLEVLGKRSDGYHELDTLMVAVDLFDEIVLTPLPAGEHGLHVTVSGTPVPADESNLAVAAVRVFENMTGLTAALSVSLAKRIPVGAGLGGGSGNAAGVLLALQHLHGRPLNRLSLHEAAASLGADVPFFLLGGAARCRGRGEVLSPCHPHPSLRALLICPDVTVSTKDVYKEYEKRSSPSVNSGILRVKAEDTGVWVGSGSSEEEPIFRPDSPPWTEMGLPQSDLGRLGRNDLELAATTICPALSAVRGALEGEGFRGVTLSGSGAAFFLPLVEEADPDQMCATIQRLEVGVVHRVRSCL